MNDRPGQSEIRQRVVRVFISSTFRDMRDERDELARRVFPQLRKLCEQRGVTWTDVDLRWGITDEQAAEGKVLPICLSEINNCRPFFIGLLGQRYGWVPEAGEISDDLIAEQPWLADRTERSVTELEILHGVLNDPEMANRTCFYFRDPAYIETVGPEQRSDFEESDPAARERLKALKDSIRQSGLALRENYCDPQALAEMVLTDLTTAINQEFPIGSEPDPLDAEAAEHEAFAVSRSRVYIGRDEYFARLDDHAAGDGAPLVIEGESGSGKSALLANWALRYRRDHDEPLLMHFIGASAYSADWIAMLRRIMGELKRLFDIDGEIPTEPDALRSEFTNWLHIASARGRVVLILDALNQLEDKDQAPDLVWLPPTIPANIRLIVSTLPGRSNDALTRRGWPTMKVELLTDNERRQFIGEYLATYTRSLDANCTDSIASAAQSSNPLYLQTLLDELRVVGRHEDLGDQIDEYLTAEDVPQLYEQILTRYEADYERDRPGLAREAMTLIWAARRGLSEPELLDLLGDANGPMPRAHWSLLHFAADRSLVTRSGLINFSHDYLRQAVGHKYLPTDADRYGAHTRLADYFAPRDLTDRKVDELPWQLSRADSPERLKDCIVDLEMFLELKVDTKKYELLGYWLQLGDAYDKVAEYTRALDACESAFNAGPGLGLRLNAVALFLVDECAEYAGSEPLLRCALAIAETSLGPDHPNVARSLDNLAMLLAATNRHSEAETLHRRALAINEMSFGRDHPEIATGLNNLAMLLAATNRHSEGESLYRRALAISEASLGSDHPNVAKGLNNLAGLLVDTNRHSEAEALCRRALAIKETSFGPDHPEIATGLNNLAMLLAATNRHSEAEPLYRRALAINEASLGPNHPDVARDLNNLAELFRVTNRHSEAEPLYRRALVIRESSLGPNHPDVATNLNNLALLLVATNRHTEAEPLYRRALAIDEASFGPDHPKVAAEMNNLALLLEDTGRHSEAEPLYRRSLAIWEASFGPDHPDVAKALNNLAELLRRTNHYSEARPLSRRHVDILLKFTATTGRPHPHLRAAVNNYGGLLLAMGLSDADARREVSDLLAQYGMSLG